MREKRDRDVFRKRTGKAKKQRFYIRAKSKKGAQSAGEEGKYRSTATTTTATELAAV